MFWYVLRRVLIAVPLLLGITFISFLVIHLAPGDPVDFHTGDLSPDSSAQAKQMLRQQYGLDKPLPVQYWNWLTRLARLDFGRSFAPDGRPVLQKIAERLPITLLLNVIEMAIILALAVPIGVFSATRQYSRFDKATTIFVFVGFATPDLVRAPADDGVRLVSRLADFRPARHQLGVPLVLAAAVGLPQPPLPAHHRGDVRGPGRLLEVHAPEHARGRPSGLHPVGAGQGPGRARRHREARPPERHAAHRHDPRALAARADRRQ